MDLEKIESLLKMLAASDVSEFNYRDDQIRLVVRLGQQPVVTMAAPMIAAPTVAAPATPAHAAAPASPQEAGLATVVSPMVGTFYAAKAPGAEPFVEVGQRVSVGQTLCIIEAMKLMNPIESEVGGVIVARLVSDGSPVEFGKPLFTIRPG